MIDIKYSIDESDGKTHLCGTAVINGSTWHAGEEIKGGGDAEITALKAEIMDRFIDTEANPRPPPQEIRMIPRSSGGWVMHIYIDGEAVEDTDGLYFNRYARNSFQLWDKAADMLEEHG